MRERAGGPGNRSCDSGGDCCGNCGGDDRLQTQGRCCGHEQTMDETADDSRRGMTGQPSYCGVILAAGTSSRMGRDKALLPWPAGSATGTFLSRAIDVLGPTTEMV